MLPSIILSFLLVASYVGAAIWKDKKLPESISAMVYILPKGGWQWLWTIWLVIIDILIFPEVIEILDHRRLGVLGFIPMVLLAFVAVFPLFDTEHRKYHYILGILAGICS